MSFDLLEIYRNRLKAVIAGYKKFQPNFDKKIQNDFIGQGFLIQTSNGIPQDTSVTEVTLESFKNKTLSFLYYEVV